VEGIQGIMKRLSESGRTFEPKSEEEFEKFKADDYNRKPGNLHEEDGYNCPICRNKGDICGVEQNARGNWFPYHSPCKCTKIRNNIRRMQRSGLGDVIREKTFDKYQVIEPWHKTIKDKAMAYTKNPEGWFALLGQSGAGKTHICTAICREFLWAGREVLYSRWTDDIAALKGYEKKDPEKRMEMMNRLKEAEVLYIDDLFKPYEKDGIKQMPSGWDKQITFELINYRADKPGQLTIISSEWTQDGLVDIDEATGGRIFEKAGEFGISISKDRSKNYRLRKAVTI